MTRATSSRATVKGNWKYDPATLYNPLKKVKTPLMAVGDLSGGPKAKSRNKKHEVTPTKKETLQNVTSKATGRSNGRSRKKLPLSQGSPQNSLESTSRRTRTRQTSEPSLASTPVRGSYADRVPQILESPVGANQETKRSARVRTRLKVFDQNLQLILFSLGSLNVIIFLCCWCGCPCADTRHWITMLQGNNDNQASQKDW